MLLFTEVGVVEQVRGVVVGRLREVEAVVEQHEGLARARRALRAHRHPARVERYINTHTLPHYDTNA